MKIPSQLMPMLQGAGLGAIAVTILGFTWGGWMTGGTADGLAKDRVSKAVIASLAPICLDNFRRSKDASAQLVELKKVNSWEQASFVEKGGWAKMPGATTTDTVMARACAELIVAEKS